MFTYVSQENKSPLLNAYQLFVSDLASAKSTKDFESRMGTLGLGLSDEAGECSGIIKKVLYHGQEFTQEKRDDLIKEMGDVMWYLTFGCCVLGISLEEVIKKNMEKLKDRYKGGVFTVDEFLAKEKRKEELKEQVNV